MRKFNSTNKRSMEETEKDCCIRGYHVYNDIWEAAVGESLTCERETNNSRDRYAFTVKKSETVIGHLPRKVARLCYRFLLLGGMVDCIVSGSRKYSADLPQGWLDMALVRGCTMCYTSWLEIISLCHY